MRPHRPARQPLRLYRLRPAAHVALAPSPAKAGEGWGGVSSKISANREHPLPASPCLRRGRGQDKSSRLKPLLRSEEHTSELQSLMRISYAVFCLKKKKQKTNNNTR